MDRPQVLLREARSIPLYNSTPGRVCDDDFARYAADSRTEDEFVETITRHGGKSQRVNLR